jgi:hypothetical protein
VSNFFTLSSIFQEIFYFFPKNHLVMHVRFSILWERSGINWTKKKEAKMNQHVITLKRYLAKASTINWNHQTWAIVNGSANGSETKEVKAYACEMHFAAQLTQASLT